MSKATARKEHMLLQLQIAAHDKAYHGDDAPTISDAEYDRLRLRLVELEAQFPDLTSAKAASEKVGSSPLEKFGKISHRVRMLSLSNAFADEDVVEFIGRIRRFLNLTDDVRLEVTAEPKIDGLSISLRYQNGKLVEAATRGDGAEGENVTANVFTIGDVPKNLVGDFPAVIEVRGEIYMSHKDFEALNLRQEKVGERVLQIHAMRRRVRYGNLIQF